MTALRRLAAILAADAVGYSRLMGEDEASTAQAVGTRDVRRRDLRNHRSTSIRDVQSLATSNSRRPFHLGVSRAASLIHR